MVAWTSHLATGEPPRIALRHRVTHRARLGNTTRVGIDGLPVPVLRGRLHQGAVVPAAAIGTLLMWLADGLTARAAVGVFTFSIVAMLTASAVYHCHCRDEEERLHARRVDHGTILVAIAGTQTAFWLLTAPELIAGPVIVAIWVATALGFRHKVRKLQTVDSTGNWLFSALGWSGLGLVPWLAAANPLVLALVVLGGVTYSAGGVMLYRRRGELWPGVIGYHEVWHLLTIAGLVLHGTALVVAADIAAL